MWEPLPVGGLEKWLVNPWGRKKMKKIRKGPALVVGTNPSGKSRSSCDSMNAEYTLSPHLISAARNLEDRINILGLHSEAIELRDWDVFAPEIRALIPAWVPVLHSRFKIAHVALEFENYDDDAGHPLKFRWHGPKGLGLDMKGGLYRDIYYHDLINHGFIAFAADEGGPDWVASLSEGPEGNIFYFKQSEYSGEKPSEDNCLTYAHKNLASLLTAMAVSNMNYPGGHAPRSRSGVWGK